MGFPAGQAVSQGEVLVLNFKQVEEITGLWISRLKMGGMSTSFMQKIA
jgi:hypothetical protein